MATFVNDQQVLNSVADALQVGGAGNLAAFWQNVVSARAHPWAYNEIAGALAARGYTPAQIAAWDRAAEFELDLAVFRALSIGGSTQNLDDKFIKSYDRRPELRVVVVTAGGVWVKAGDTPGQVATGTYNGSADMFGTPYDPNDSRIGDERGMRF